MQKILQEMCLRLKDGNEYKFTGSEVNGLWQSGKLETANGLYSYVVENGIPRFVRPEDETWGTEEKISKDEDLKFMLAKDGLTYRNMIESMYNGRIKDDDLYNYMKPDIEEMLTENGIILECAAGPAGGYAPYITRYNPKAKVIMNEKSYWLLNEWRKLNLKTNFKNLSFALFDITDSPFLDNTFDVISSWLGMTSITSTQLGLNECYRTLKPGGKMFLHDVEISDETLSILTSEKLKEMKDNVEKSNKFGMDSYNSILSMIEETLFKQFSNAGFVNITTEAINKQKTNPKEGDIPGIFHEAGIELVYNLKKYTAKK